MISTTVCACSICHQATSAQQSLLADSTLQWRRSVYMEHRWAVPTIDNGSSSSRSSHRGSSAAVGGSKVSERCVEEWVQRELQALLLDRDVTIITAFVLGLIRSFGVGIDYSQQWLQEVGSDHSTPAAMSASNAAARMAAIAGLSGDHIQHHANSNTTAGARPVRNSSCRMNARTCRQMQNPVAALQDFLFEHAAHFWHELRCFAVSGFTVQTYDRAVKYVTGAEARSVAVDAASSKKRRVGAGWDVQPQGVRHHQQLAVGVRCLEHAHMGIQQQQEQQQQQETEASFLQDTNSTQELQLGSVTTEQQHHAAFVGQDCFNGLHQSRSAAPAVLGQDCGSQQQSPAKGTQTQHVPMSPVTALEPDLDVELDHVDLNQLGNMVKCHIHDALVSNMQHPQLQHAGSILSVSHHPRQPSMHQGSYAAAEHELPEVPRSERRSTCHPAAGTVVAGARSGSRHLDRCLPDSSPMRSAGSYSVNRWQMWRADGA
eukprot:jgi/Chrzof1/7940/Cz02g42050.t1